MLAVLLHTLNDAKADAEGFEFDDPLSLAGIEGSFKAPTQKADGADKSKSAKSSGKAKVCASVAADAIAEKLLKAKNVKGSACPVLEAKKHLGASTVWFGKVKDKLTTALKPAVDQLREFWASTGRAPPLYNFEDTGLLPDLEEIDQTCKEPPLLRTVFARWCMARPILLLGKRDCGCSV